MPQVAFGVRIILQIPIVLAEQPDVSRQCNCWRMASTCRYALSAASTFPCRSSAVASAFIESATSV